VRLFLLLLTTAFFSTTASSQNIALDKKKGFNNFIIGEDKSKFVDRLEYYKTTESGNVGYKLKSGNSNDFLVFRQRFNLVILFFDKNNKLATINLLNQYDKDSYGAALNDLKLLIADLKILFGKPSENYYDEKEPRLGTVWAGAEIILMCTNELDVNMGSQTEIMINGYAKAMKDVF